MGPGRPRREPPPGWFLKVDDREARLLREFEVVAEVARTSQRERRYEESILAFESGREILRGLEVQYGGYSEPIFRNERHLALVKADKLEWDREHFISMQNARQDREIMAERERAEVRALGASNRILPAPAVAFRPPLGLASWVAPRFPASPPTGQLSALRAHTTRLVLPDGAELPFVSVAITARIDAGWARVVVDLRFDNPEDRRDSVGQFDLRLPDGASPYFLAFGRAGPSESVTAMSLADVAAFDLTPPRIMDRYAGTGGTLRDAKVVERARARDAFDQTVGRRVDPALLEWAGAGVFNASVYPIAARGSYRVVLGYDLPLAREVDARVLLLDVPPGLAGATCDVGVGRDGSEVAVEPLPVARFAGDRRWYRAEPGSAGRVVARITGATARTLVGEDPAIGPCFASCVEPALPPSDADAGPRRAVFVIDRSRSCPPERMARALAVVDAILTQNRARLTEFAVLLFANDAVWWRRGYAPNTERVAAECVADCRAVALEGATDLTGALDLARHPPGSPPGEAPDALFLLSDGVATWGDDVTGQLAGAPPVYAYDVGLGGTDAGRLRDLARVTGGEVFAVTDAADLAAVALAHARRTWRILGATVEGTRDVLIAGAPTAVVAGQALTLAGRGRVSDRSELVLELTDGRANRTVRCPLGRAVASDLAARLYGQLATAELADARDGPADLAVSYARHFRIPGRSCSLLMLESDADYQRYGIGPAGEAALDREAVAERAVRETLAHMRGDGGARQAFFAAIDRRRRAAASTVELAATEELRAATAAVPDDAFLPPREVHTDLVGSGSALPEAYRQAMSVGDAYPDALRAEAVRRDRAGDPTGALRCLSSPIDRADAPDAWNAPSGPVGLRAVGQRAMAAGAYAQAYRAFARLADLRPAEPEPWLAMATCLAQSGRAEMALVCAEIARATPWTGDVGELPAAAAAVVVILPILDALSSRPPGPLTAWVARERAAVIGSLVDHPQPLVVTVDWSRADGVDLVVRDASGERVGRQATWAWGRPGAVAVGPGLLGASRSGRVLFALPRAAPGRYRVMVESSARPRRNEGIVAVHRHWGRPEYRVTHHHVVLAAGATRAELVSTVDLP